MFKLKQNLIVAKQQCRLLYSYVVILHFTQTFYLNLSSLPHSGKTVWLHFVNFANTIIIIKKIFINLYSVPYTYDTESLLTYNIVIGADCNVHTQTNTPGVFKYL